MMGEAADLEPSGLVTSLRPGTWVILLGCILLLVGLCLDWISVACSGPFCGIAGTVGGSGFHGWGWLSFVALLATLLLLALRTVLRGTVAVPPLPAPDAAIFMVLGGLGVLGCLLFRLEYEGGFTSVSVGGVSVSLGLGVGWFLALVGGAAVILGGYLDRTRGAPPSAAPPPPPEVPASCGHPRPEQARRGHRGLSGR
jgi:hypothetical protein